MTATIETLAEVSAIDAPERHFAAIVRLASFDGGSAEGALAHARTVFLDALADMFLALNQPDGMRAVRALLAGNVQPGGTRVPGTSYELDPRAAATAMETLTSIGRLAHGRQQNAERRSLRAAPLSAILAVADSIDRKRIWRGAAPVTVGGVLQALIKAEQIRRMLEGSACLAMSEQQCLLGATTVATLRLLSGNARQMSAVLRDVWQATAATAAVSWHAEAVQRAFAVGAHGLPADPVDSAPCDAIEVFLGASSEPSEESWAVVQRFEAAVKTRLPLKQCERIQAIMADPVALESMAINAFMAELVANQA